MVLFSTKNTLVSESLKTCLYLYSLIIRYILPGHCTEGRVHLIRLKKV